MTRIGYLSLFATLASLPVDWADDPVVFRSDVALVFGGQLNLGKIKLGLRYQEGLNNVNAINSTDAWRTYGLQFYAGFQIKDRKLK